jgi:hypothetical protein
MDQQQRASTLGIFPGVRRIFSSFPALASVTLAGDTVGERSRGTAEPHDASHAELGR